MDGRISNYSTGGAFGDVRYQRHITDNLCDYGDCPVLFSDHHSGVRNMAPPSQSEPPRQLQVMAELLTPFAGQSAPRLAEAVRARFGTLATAMSASESQLHSLGAEFSGACELMLAARNLVDSARHEQISSAKVDPHDLVLQQYLRSRIGQCSRERLLVIFCGQDGNYLLDEEMGWGTANNVHLNMASLFRKALVVEASSILLAHNHPSGRCLPSQDDIDSTQKLASIAQALGLKMLDHLIVTRGQCYSIRIGATL